MVQQPATSARSQPRRFQKQHPQPCFASVYSCQSSSNDRRASLPGLERVPMGKPLPRRRQPGAVTPQLRPGHPLFACGRSVSVTSRRNRSGRCCVALQAATGTWVPPLSRLVSQSSSTRVKEGSRHRATELDLGASLLPGGPPTKVSRGNQGPRQRPPARCRGTRTRRDRIASNGGAPRLPGGRGPMSWAPRCLGRETFPICIGQICFYAGLMLLLTPWESAVPCLGESS